MTTRRLGLLVQSVPDQYDGVILTKRIGNTEMINLALGRPLDTAIDKNTEMLAGAGTFADEPASTNSPTDSGTMRSRSP